MTVRRLLLARRRIDPILLALAFAFLVLMLSAGKVLFGFFAACGLYLSVLRHRVRRRIPRLFLASVLAFVGWTLATTLLHGESLFDNREMSYALVILGSIFLPAGLCLMPRPMTAMVAGARATVALVTLLALYQYLMLGQRVGLGGNEAVFGFLASIAGILSRLPAPGIPRGLRAPRFFFYLSILPVLLSETRAAWFVYPPIALFDIVVLLAGAHAFASGRKLRLLVGAILCVALAVPAVRIAETRFSAGFAELERFRATGEASGSVDVRLAMWSGALGVVAEHPVAGVGWTHRIEAVAGRPDMPPANAALIRTYKHLHNLFVDQATATGLVGLALLLVLFAAFLIGVFRRTERPGERLCAAALVGQTVVFGSFQGVMVNEWTLMMIFGAMAVLLMERRVPTGRAP